MKIRNWKRTFIRLGLIVTLFSTTGFLTACGGGGGDTGSPAPPQTGGNGTNTPPPATSTKGTGSGTLIVPPNNTVEMEPNDSINQAQAVSGDLSISGTISETEPGFVLPGGQVVLGDLYRLTATGPVRIILSIAVDDLNTTDLDLALMDPSGNLLETSEGFVSTEFIETTAGGTFLVGIRAFQGTSAYVLDFSPLGGLASTQSPIPVGAEFVPGEILVKLKKAASGNVAKPGVLLAKHGLTHKQSLPPGVELMQVSVGTPAAHPGKPSGRTKLNLPGSQENSLKAQTLDTIKRLRKNPDVVYAEANFIRQPFLLPNDEYFKFQWHYPLMNLPQAWDVTTGRTTSLLL